MQGLTFTQKLALGNLLHDIGETVARDRTVPELLELAKRKLDFPEVLTESHIRNARQSLFPRTNNSAKPKADSTAHIIARLDALERKVESLVNASRRPGLF